MSAAVSAGRAFIQIYGDKTPLVSELKAAEDSLKQWVNNVGKVVAGTGAAFTVSLIPAIMKAANHAETLNAFEAVFKGANREAETLAVTLGKKVGLSLRPIREGMTSFGAMAKGLGMSADEAAKFSAQTAAMALDLKSFRNLSIDDAMRRFTSALSGSSEVLDTYGVNLKEQALSAELAALGLAKNVHEASELAKVQARLSIIKRSLDEQGATGDAERTMKSTANAVSRLVEAFGDLQEAVGGALDAAFGKVVNVLVSVTEKATAFANEHPRLIQAFAAASIAAVALGTSLMFLTTAVVVPLAPLVMLGVAAIRFIGPMKLLTMLTGSVSSGFNLMGKAFQGLVTVTPIVSRFFPLLGTGLRAIIGSVTAAGTALATLTNPITWIAGGLALLHAKFGTFNVLIDVARAIVTNYGKVFKESILPVLRKVGAIASYVGSVFKAGFTDTLTGATKILNLLSDALKAVAEVMAGALLIATQNIMAVMKGMAGVVDKLLDKVLKLLGIDYKAPKDKTEPQGKPKEEKQKKRETPEERKAREAAEEAQRKHDEDLQQFADQSIESTTTPKERYDAAIAQLNEAFNKKMLTQEQFIRGRAKALEELNRDTGVTAQKEEMQRKADELAKNSRTPIDILNESIAEANKLFNAGLITEQVHAAALQSARDEFNKVQMQAVEEARKQEEERQKQLMERINQRADNKIALAKAHGDKSGEQSAIGQKADELLNAGFAQEAFDVATAQMASVLSASKDATEKANKSRDSAGLITFSRGEAASGLGTNTVDEQLLEKQGQLLNETRDSREQLKKIVNALTE